MTVLLKKEVYGPVNSAQEPLKLQKKKKKRVSERKLIGFLKQARFEHKFPI